MLTLKCSKKANKTGVVLEEKKLMVFSFREGVVIYSVENIVMRLLYINLCLNLWGGNLLLTNYSANNIH